MLECSALLLGSWTTASATSQGGRSRSVRAVGGEALGFVHQRDDEQSGWLGWFGRQRIDVLESPDDSLVFSLQRGRLAMAGWELFDADDRHVGTIRGRALMDGCGYLLAAVEAPDATGRGRFLSAEGRVLGEYQVKAKETTVHFAAQLEGNPFARMLLLGGLLITMPTS
jgi:hypothetical protein